MDRLNTQTWLRRRSPPQPVTTTILAIRRPSTTHFDTPLFQSRGYSQDPRIPRL